MPTGYTAPIEDDPNYTFQEYILSCSHAFVGRHDTSATSDPERERSPDRYHDICVTKLKEKLAEMRTKTAEEAAVLANLEYAERLRMWEEGSKNARARYARYMAMRARAEAWVPPTPKHAALREFMISQIDESVKFMDPTGESYKPKLETGEEWRASNISALEQVPEYHTKGWEEEQERCRAYNRWMADLLAAIPPDEAAP